MLQCSSYWKTQVDVNRTSYLILVHALKIKHCMPKGSVSSLSGCSLYSLTYTCIVLILINIKYLFCFVESAAPVASVALLHLFSTAASVASVASVALFCCCICCTVASS